MTAYPTRPPPTLATPPPETSFVKLSYPAPRVLLVTMSRPRDLNCINHAGHLEMDRVWRWLDSEQGLSVGVLTGEGRAFCAGLDLKEWNQQPQDTTSKPIQPVSTGFGGLSRRTGLKPVICALNGLAYGGGCEMMVNADLVFACSGATIALPEVKRGLVALAGAPPRLVRTVGKQRAMEMVLTGRTVSASEACSWGLVNRVVEGGAEEVVSEAVKVAGEIASQSPDAVIVSREGVNVGWDGSGAEEGTTAWERKWAKKLVEGENFREGIAAFVEKRKPTWKPAKL